MRKFGWNSANKFIGGEIGYLIFLKLGFNDGNEVTTYFTAL